MIFNIFATAVLLLNLVLSLVVFLKKQTAAGTFFALFGFSCTAWIALLYLTINTSSLLAGRLAIAVGVLGLGFMLLFALAFPEDKRPEWKTILSILMPAGLLSIITATTPLTVVSLHVADGGIVGQYGPFIFAFRLLAPIYAIWAVGLLFKKCRRYSGLKKTQLRFTLAGIMLTIIPIIVTNTILPTWLGISRFNSWGPLFSIFMIAFIGYAIIKHHLLDIKFIIQRSLAFTVSLVVISGLFALFTATFSLVFGDHGLLSYPVSAALTAVIGAFGLNAFLGAFYSLTDGFFYKNKYNYSQAVNHLIRIMHDNYELDSITTKSLTYLQDTLKTQNIKLAILEKSTIIDSNGATSLYDPQKHQEVIDIARSLPGITAVAGLTELIEPDNLDILKKLGLARLEELTNELGIELIVPIYSQQQLIAVLLLGDRLSGESFSKQDLDLLTCFALQSAVAIEKALLYEKVICHSKELESKVEQRTEKIKKLQESQRQLMLEISHNLQTPLTIIKGELDIIKQKSPDSKVLKSFDKSIDRLSRFIYGILRLAKLESGKDGFEINHLDLSCLLAELAEDFEILVQGKGISLNKNIQAGVMIAGNCNRLEELFTNLVGNAAKYMDSNKTDKQITINLTKKDGYAVVEIKDNGIGIASEDMQKIFEGFYRAKQDKNQKVEGTGLGLAICKKIAQQHGGSISVTSQLGQGSVFSVNLQLVK